MTDASELYTTDRLAGLFGITSARFIRLARRRGILPDRFGPDGGYLWDLADFVPLLREAIEQGLTTSEIADRLGCTKANVWQIARRHGVKPIATVPGQGTIWHRSAAGRLARLRNRKWLANNARYVLPRAWCSHRMKAAIMDMAGLPKKGRRKRIKPKCAEN